MQNYTIQIEYLAIYRISIDTHVYHYLSASKKCHRSSQSSDTRVNLFTKKSLE